MADQVKPDNPFNTPDCRDMQNGHGDDDSGRLLAARMGHEINNLAQSLQADLQTLQALWNKMSPALQAVKFPASAIPYTEIPVIFGEMTACLDRMAGIVRVAKYRPGEFKLAEQPIVNTRRLLEQVVSTIHPQAGGAVIAVNLPRELPDIQGNYDQLAEVFTNLGLNGLQAAGISPVPELTISGSVADGKVAIEISDNGPGIAPEIINKLFQPFFSTRRDKGGTGLGLFICREIIQRHKGVIKAGNRPAGGAVFTVRLPRCAALVP